MRFLITGATGFIGRHLVDFFVDRGDEVIVLTRNPQKARRLLPKLTAAYLWRMGEAITSEAFQGVDAVVHLAGEPVAGLWTKRKRDAIRGSRVQGTAELVRAMVAQEKLPDVFVSASAIGYYGIRGDAELTETSPPGDDFLASVCKQWEHEAQIAGTHGIRTACLRTGIVLGSQGGALPLMLLPAKLGVSGPLGSGQQWWSWVHIKDLVRLVEYIIEEEDVSGPINGTAPHPVRQKEFAKTLGRIIRRPAVIPAPAPVLKTVLGGFSVELLGSKRVLPAKALDSGFEYRFARLEEALQDAVFPAA